MKRFFFGVIFTILVVATLATIGEGQGGAGLFIRSSCGSIASPISGQTWCFETSTSRLKYWNGSAFISASVSTIPVGTVDGGTGIDTSASTGVPSIASGTWSVAAQLSALRGGTNLNTSALTGTPIIDSGVWSVPATLSVIKGGTNLASGTSGGILGYTASGTLASSVALTANGLVIGGGAGATPTAIAALTNGQIVVGSTGVAPVPTTLTGGNGISITNGAGSVTIATSTNVITILDRAVGTQDVVNTTTETSVYSFTVPGGTLGTNRALRLTLTGDYLNNAAATPTFLIKVKYGGTTIFNGNAPALIQSAFRFSIDVVTMLSANNATNSQIARTWYQGSVNNGMDGTGLASGKVSLGQFDSPQLGLHNSLAIDSTVNQTLTVTFTHNTANTLISGRRHTVQLELL